METISGMIWRQWWTMMDNVDIYIYIQYIYIYICFKWITLTKIRWPTTKLGFSLEIKAQKISARIVLAGHFQQQPSKNDCRSSPLVIHVHDEKVLHNIRMALRCFEHQKVENNQSLATVTLW